MAEKHLWLIRHAKAAKNGENDHDRELSTRGYRQCVATGQALAAELEPPRVFLTSPARRALTTAQILSAFVNGSVETVNAMYTFDLHTLFSALSDEICDLTNHDVNSLAVVGHNGAISNLISELTHGMDAPLLPTLGIAHLSFEAEWDELFVDDIDNDIPCELRRVLRFEEIDVG